VKRLAAGACCAAAVAGAAPAQAASPAAWVATSTSSVSSDYRQGLAGDTSGNVFFSGAFVGIHRTRDLVDKATNSNAIPPDVQQREQYNHIGDIAWDPAEGGRILLPLESYAPFAPDKNPSKTGSIGVMDPATLKWRYYVKLDPLEIPKTQWVATDPTGFVWTLSGTDLLAYRMSEVTQSNAAPDGPLLHAAQRLVNAAPNGAGGAAYLRGRLYMSTGAATANKLVSVDTVTGAARTEYELTGNLEAEGVDVGAYLGGILHWELVPGGGLSNAQLVNLLPADSKLKLKLSPGHVKSGKAAAVKATVVAAAQGYKVPLGGVRVTLGRAKARTDAAGRATLKVKLTRGLYRAHAFFKGLRTASAWLRAT